MEYVTLNNGIKMSKLGYGVYQTPPEDTKRCVLDAIDVVYPISLCTTALLLFAALVYYRPVKRFAGIEKGE